MKLLFEMKECVAAAGDMAKGEKVNCLLFPGFKNGLEGWSIVGEEVSPRILRTGLKI